MKTNNLKQLLEQTFAKLACPSQGHGMYSELEKALIDAFNMGKAQQEGLHMIKPLEELSMEGIRA